MTYLIWKLIHIVSVVIFLGNIFTGLFWAAKAHKTHDPKLTAITFQNIIHSDRYFTLPGVLGIIISGFSAAIYGRIPILSTGWIFWPIVLFTISGIIYSVYLAPLQRKILLLAKEADNISDYWSNYEKLYKQWEYWGFFAIITPAAALVIMILKPFLPGYKLLIAIVCRF